MRDCNEEALNKYMDEVEAAEKATEDFLEAIADELEVISDAVYNIKQTAKNNEGFDMSETIDEAIKEQL